MTFYPIKNIIIVLGLCLLGTGCASNNSWKVAETFDIYEKMLAREQYGNRAEIALQGLELESAQNSYIIQGLKHKNTAYDIENNSVFILTKDDVGSGFFIAPGIIITNKHVVKKNKRVIIFGESLKTPQLAIVKAVSMGKGQDYAILKLVQDNYGPKGLALCAQTAIGENVSTWGFPLNALRADIKFKMLQAGEPNAMPEIVYSEGVIIKFKNAEPVHILHTATISHGSSGSPLANADYCIVGINTLLHTDKKTKKQTSIALDIEGIVTFIKKNGVEPLSYQP